MIIAEAAALLAVCSAFDNRKPDADQARAWWLALEDLDFTECRDAVVEHYRATRDWVMPSDLRQIVRRKRTSRIEDDVIHMPRGLDPDDTEAYVRVLRDGRRALAEGRPQQEPPVASTGAPPAVRALLEGMRTNPKPPQARRSPQNDPTHRKEPMTVLSMKDYAADCRKRSKAPDATEDDKKLWAQLADEADAYLAGDGEQVEDLFGQAAIEPVRQEDDE